MNQKLLNLLQVLLDEDRYMTSVELASYFNVSTRTIRNYIFMLNNELKSYNIGIYGDKKLGYYITANDRVILFQNIEKIYSSQYKDYPRTKLQRQCFSVVYMLIKDDYVTLQEIADTLYVSKSTVQNDFETITTLLDFYSLEIDISISNGHRIRTNERKRRNIINNIFMYNLADNKMSRTILKIIMNHDYLAEYRAIYQSIVDYLMDEKHYPGTTTISSLTFDFLISMICSQKNTWNDDKEELYEITKKLREYVDQELPESEWFYIQDSLLSRIFVSEKENKLTNLILYDFIEVCKMQYHFDPSIMEDQLRNHLFNILYRTRNHLLIQNPLKFEIIKNHPTAYEIAFCIEDIATYAGVALTKDEIASVALNFVDIYKMNKKYLNIGIVSQYGGYINNYLEQKLKLKFGLDKVKIYKYQSYELEYYLNHHEDLNLSMVVSTDLGMKAKLENENIPVYITEPIIGEKELNQILYFANTQGRKAQEKEWFSYIDYYEKKNVIEVVDSFYDIPLEYDIRHLTPLDNKILLIHMNCNKEYLKIYLLKNKMNYQGTTIQQIVLYGIDYGSIDEIERIDNFLPLILKYSEWLNYTHKDEYFDRIKNDLIDRKK